MFYHETDMEDDSMVNTALTFVFLFLITLFYSIGVTVIKVRPDPRNKQAQPVTEPNITISITTSDDIVRLLCWLDGFRPNKVNVEWYKGEELLREKSTLKVFEASSKGEKMFAALCELSINTEQWNDGTEFTCQATHNSKTFKQTWSKCKAHPTSKPLIRLEKPRLVSVLTDSEVTVSCVVETMFNIQVSWLVDGKKKKDKMSTKETRLGKTVSNLTISTADWKTVQKITCIAKHPCFNKVEETIDTTEPVQRTPTVVIRRILTDGEKGDSAVLVCAARDLPSGELAITLQANEAKLSDAQYVDLPKGQDTLTARFTVSKTTQSKDQRYTCQIQQSSTNKWESNSTGNIFGDPSVELSVVSTVDKSASKTQKLLCSGTGLNPKIKWLPKSVLNDLREVTVQADGRVKVSSEISLPQQEWNNGGEFTCEVSDQDHKPVQKSTSVCAAHPTSKPLIRLEKPRLVSVLTDSEITVSCVVETMFNTQVSWLVDGKEKEATTSTEATRLGKTVSNLTISTADWKTVQKITCIAKHPCFNKVEETIDTTGPVQKTPTVVIRRILTDGEKGDSAVLVCAARDLPSGELAVTLQANEAKHSDTQYVDLPKGQDTLTARFTVSKTTQSKDQRYTCQIQQSSTNKWESNSTGNIFGDPSVELSVVSTVDKSASKTQKLLCSGTGLNPKIKWLPKSVLNDLREVTVQADGRVKVSSEISLPQQDWNNGGEFTCEVSDQDHKPVQKSTSVCAVTPASAPMAQVYLLGPSITDMRTKDLVPVTCLLLGRRLKDFSIIWKVGKDNYSQNATTQTPKEHSNGTQSVQSVLNVPAAEWKKDTTVSCEVKHLCSKNAQQHNISKTRASVNEHPPSMELLQGRDELVCLVYGFSPSAINITWLLNSVSVHHEDNTSSSAKGPDGKFSIKSHLNVQAAEWAPGATYTCHVRHVTGTINRSISKTEFIEETIYFDENKSETSTLDQAEETWNMACAFIILFVISLVYGCSMTLVKVKMA
ncbi:titin-like [Neoarius graeffei]|uniref:titin-like n=1 Tax=Neoarius graeffei TaxID=443677 RepID=UPI00298CA1FE|nr:titin-like [Neoarius graeffei]